MVRDNSYPELPRDMGTWRHRDMETRRHYVCVLSLCEPPHHDGGEVLALEAADGLVQGLVHGGRDPLGDQTVQVDGAAQQLNHGTPGNNNNNNNNNNNEVRKMNSASGKGSSLSIFSTRSR